jgi:hypothetical protein
MADIGAVRGQLNGIPDATTKRILINVFEYLLGNMRFGEPENQTRAENFQAYFLNSTTPASTNEFSIAHGLHTTPKLLIPVIDPQTVGSKFPQLEISRAADDRRIYLKATAGSTGMAFTLLVEA